MEEIDTYEAKDATSITSIASSPTSTTDFIYVDDNVSNSSKKSENSNGSSFADVLNNDDFMPKMGESDHNQDVSKLVSEAQMDDFISDYYADDRDQVAHDTKSIDSRTFRSHATLTNETESPQTSDEEEGSLKRSTSDGEAKDACVLFHGITYLGASNVNAPVSELELKRALSILRDHSEGSIDIILAVSLSPSGTIRFIDPESRTDIAMYDIDNICFWGKGESDSIEKDCLAFNISQGKEDVTYHCHVFKCAEEDDVTRILQSLAQTIKKDQKRKQLEFPIGRRGSTLDPNNLNFKFNVVLDVWEEDGKGSYQTVARDRNHFKLRVELQRKIVFIIEQMSNRKLKIERCFGLLLAQGKDVPDEELHLLQQVEIDRRPGGKRTVISGHWDPNLEFWKVLNIDPVKDNKVNMTVAADIIFEDLKEPVRFIKEAKVRVFPLNEKFWNPAKPRIQEEFTLQLKENFTELGEKWFEKESLHSASDIAKLKSVKHSSNSISSIWKNGRPKSAILESISVEPEEIMGPEDSVVQEQEDEEEEYDDEPLLSGSGEFERTYSDGEMSNWNDILAKWKELDHRPSKVLQSVRKGIPDPIRGQVWQMLSGLGEDPELLQSYAVLCKKDSPQEQVILWDVTRTFPAHEYFREANGEGQNALYNISKAYSVYDEEVGYCQGLSFIIAAFLLHVPEEQAYCLLVKTMYEYGHRELFRDGFAYLHQSFYVLERVLEDNLNDLYQHFRAHNIEIHMFASQWFLTLYTAKFPLSLVYNIIDIVLCEGLDIIFQVAAALLKNARKDLLALNFEGILKYFRINLPKYYMLENHRKELLRVIYELKISKKKVQKYKQEYIQIIEEQELKEDPVKRLERENQRLQQEQHRLESENDSLAYEVVTTQVSMQEVITDREEKLNELTKETEQMRKHLMEAEEEAERLRMEEARVKDMWRGSMNTADEERAKRDRIIDGYKQILTRLEERSEKTKKDFADETVLLKNQISSCENCANALLKTLYPDSDKDRDDSLEPHRPAVTRLLSKEDHEEQMRSLEEELIKTKVALAEEKNRADEIEMRLHNLASANDKPWYKKVTITNKK